MPVGAQRDRDNIRHIADLMSGADVRYDTAGGPAHPMAGRWMPDLALCTDAGPARVAELMRGGRPVLLTLADHAAHADTAKAWTGRVDLVAATVTATAATTNATTNATAADPPADAALIRPDGYVAWATGPGTPPDAEGLRRALRIWFGPLA